MRRRSGNRAAQYRVETAVSLFLILCLALFFRWRGLNWDQYQHYHPDERYISWVATSIEFDKNSNLREALNPVKSNFNPFYWPAEKHTVGVSVLQDSPRDFAYGHLPLYLGVLTTRLFEQVSPSLQPILSGVGLNTSGLNQHLLNAKGLNEFDHITLIGRWLTGLFDAATILLLYLLGRRLHSKFVGLIAAAFMAVNVMHIQLSHFFISDTYMTFFIVLALFLMVLAVTRQEKLFNQTKPFLSFTLILVAAAVGLAVGSKFSAILLALPFVTTIFLYDPNSTWRKIIWRVLTLGLLTVLFFFITNPFAILDNSCQLILPLGQNSIQFSMPGSCYLTNIGNQNAMVRGSIRFPFTNQYLLTFPYLYFIENQINWGMGLLLGGTAFIGFVGWSVVAGRQVWLAMRQQNWTPQAVSPLIVLAWVWPFFLTTGSFTVKFMRYMQPLTPFLMLFAAWLLYQIRLPWLRNLAISIVFIFTLGYAFAFSNIYREPHPWQTASIWLFDHADPDAVIVNEIWDEPVPSKIPDEPYASRPGFTEESVNWLSGQFGADDAEKLEKNLNTLAEADYLVIASNRSYGVTPRLSLRYPLSSQYYPLLFAEELGFEPVYIIDRAPTIFGFSFSPDTFRWPKLEPPQIVSDYYAVENRTVSARADESFTVYDQPLTIIFVNKERMTKEMLLSKFILED